MTTRHIADSINCGNNWVFSTAPVYRKIRKGITRFAKNMSLILLYLCVNKLSSIINNQHHQRALNI